MDQHNPVIDASGESAKVLKNLTHLSKGLQDLFQSDDQRALALAQSNPEFASSIAASRRAGTTIFPGMKNGVVDALTKIFPTTPQEEKNKLDHAKQVLAEQKQNFDQSKQHATEIVQTDQLLDPVRAAAIKAGAIAAGAYPTAEAPIPETASQRFLRLASDPNINPEDRIAIGSKLFEDNRRASALRMALAQAPNAFGPEHVAQFKAAIDLIEAGDQKAGEAMIPPNAEQQLDIETKTRAIAADKNKYQADENAKPVLQSMGFKLPDGHIEGLADKLVTEISKVHADNRQRSLVLEKDALQNKDRDLLGKAFLLTNEKPNASAIEIATLLQKSAPGTGLGDLVLAASKAKEEYRKMSTMSATETKNKGLALTGRRGLADAIVLAEKGYSISSQKVGMAEAEIHPAIGFGLGAAVGGVGTTAATAMGGGAVAAAVASGGLAIPLIGLGAVGIGTLGALSGPVINKLGRMLMTDNEQLMYTASKNAQEALLRTETGAVAPQTEVNRMAIRLAVLDTDKPLTRQMKIEIMKDAEVLMSKMSDMPKAKASQAIKLWGQKADEALSNARTQDSSVGASVNALITKYGSPEKALSAIHESQKRFMSVGRPIQPFGVEIQKRLQDIVVEKQTLIERQKGGFRGGFGQQ